MDGPNRYTPSPELSSFHDPFSGRIPMSATGVRNVYTAPKRTQFPSIRRPRTEDHLFKCNNCKWLEVEVNRLKQNNEKIKQNLKIVLDEREDLRNEVMLMEDKNKSEAFLTWIHRNRQVRDADFFHHRACDQAIRELQAQKIQLFMNNKRLTSDIHDLRKKVETHIREIRHIREMERLNDLERMKLQEQLDNCFGENEKLRDNEDQLRNTVTGLENSAVKQKEGVCFLIQRVHSLQEANEKQADQIRQQQTDLRAYKISYRGLKTEYDEVVGENEHLQSKVEKLTQSQLHDSFIEGKESSQQVTELQKKLSELSQSVDEISKLKEKTESQLKEKINTNLYLNKRVKDLTKNCDYFENALKEERDKKTSAQSAPLGSADYEKLSEMRKEIERLTNSMSVLQQQNRDMKAELRQSEDKWQASLEQEQGHFNQEKKTLQRHIDDLEEKQNQIVEDHMRKSSQTELYVRQLRQENEDKEDELKSLRQQIKDIEHKKTERLPKMEAETIPAYGNLDNTDEDAALLFKTVETASYDKTKKNKDFAKSDDKAELESKICQLKENVEEMKQKNMDLETKIDTRNSELSNIMQEKARIEQENKHLRTRIQQSEDILRRDKEANDNKIKVLEEKLIGTNTELTEIKSNLLAREAENTKSHKDVQQIKQEKDRMERFLLEREKSASASFDEDKTGLEKEVIGLKEQVSKLTQDKYNSEIKEASLTSKVAQLQQDKTNLEAENTVLKKSHAEHGEEMRQENDKKDNEFLALQEKLNRAKADLRQSHMEKQMQVEKLNQERDEMQKELNSFSQKETKMKSDHEIIKQELEKLKELQNSYVQSNKEAPRKITELSKRVDELKQEKSDLLYRLSQIASSRLTEGNPAIVDLSDDKKPTKLAEIYSELYDNEWTEAFDEQTNDFQKQENDAIQILLQILQTTHLCCNTTAGHYLTNLSSAASTFPGRQDIMLFQAGPQGDAPVLLNKTLRQIQTMSTPAILNVIKKELENKWTEMMIEAKTATSSYINKCLELCCEMSVKDPPVVLMPTPAVGSRVDKDRFRFYTQSGSLVDYVVWPTLLLHERGPTLAKGVLQGKDS